MGSSWYEIRVQGHLGRDWSDWFDEMEILYVSDHETVIEGWVADQAALHGCLAKIRNLNLTLLSVHQVVPANKSPGRHNEQGVKEMEIRKNEILRGTDAVEDGHQSGVCVVSYSLTGNNGALAAGLANGLDAEHRKITESGNRSMMKIVLDAILKRTPKVNVDLEGIEKFGLVVFVGPVWMGQVATTFRGCFATIRRKLRDYAFVTICGGADGNNPGLESELRQRLGKDPVCVAEMHIADILPAEPKPQRKDTMAYSLIDDEIKTITRSAIKALSQKLWTRGGK